MTLKLNRVLASCLGSLLALQSFAFDFSISSGYLELPNPDGSFSGNYPESGKPVTHAYCILSAASYSIYQNSPENLFTDFVNSRADGGTNGLTIVYDKDIYSPIIRGNSTLPLGEDTMDSIGLEFGDYFDYESHAYFGGIFIYTNDVTGAYYYIANVATATTPSQEEDEDTLGGVNVQIPDLATSVGAWTLLNPPAPDLVNIRFCDSDSGVTVTNLVLEIGQPYGELPVPAARAGYLFGGWFTEEGGAGDRIEADSLVPDFDTELYAFWRINMFTVKFGANGGTGTMPAQSIICDTAAALRANAFTKSGCLFLGWAKSASGAVAYANKAKVKNLAAAGKAVTLYAKWAVAKYYVKFKANGGTLPKGKKMPVQTMAYGKAAALTKNAFVRNGYVFMGWAAGAANAKKRIVAFKNGQSVKNLRADGLTLNLYALWAKKEYRVKFHPYGGTGTMPVEVFTYGKAKALNACKFKRPGYKFVGWATSKARAKAGVVKFKNKQSVKNLKSQGETVVLYVVWKKL